MKISDFLEQNAITVYLTLALALLFLIVIIPTYRSMPLVTLVAWSGAFAFCMGMALYMVSKEYAEEEKKKVDEQKKRGENEN